MDTSTIRLQVVTPTRSLIDLNCVNVTLPGKLGEFQVLPGHTPVLSALKTGLLEYELVDSAHEKRRLMISDGFAECGAHRVTVLCDQACLPAEVNKALEEANLEQLKKQLAEGKKDDQDLVKVEAEISQSLARMRLLD